MTVRILSPADQRALDAATQRAAVFGRDDRELVWVRGQDRAKFLHNMLTQEVKDLPSGAVRQAVLCDAQGAMTAEMTLLVQPDAIALWTDRAQAQALHDALDKYVIMDDVELALDEAQALLAIAGPQAAQVLGLPLPHPELAVQVEVAGVPAWLWQDTLAGLPQLWLMVEREALGTIVPTLVRAGAAIGCHAAQEALRIRAGRARLGVDVDGGSLPLEAGLKHAVNYRKGCYLGQEAVAMMTYRGQMRRHLCWVEPLDSLVPDVGWTLKTADGKRAGRMGSTVVTRDEALGLAMVQRKAFAPGAELVASADDGASARVKVRTTTVPDVFAASEAP